MITFLVVIVIIHLSKRYLLCSHSVQSTENVVPILGVCLSFAESSLVGGTRVWILNAKELDLGSKFYKVLTLILEDHSSRPLYSSANEIKRLVLSHKSV